MAPTQAQICNLALTHIGIRQQITAITDLNQEAEMCNLHYSLAVEDCLFEADWGFARRRITLQSAAGDPPPPWSYQYQWPSNCIRLLRIDDGKSIRRARERIPFTFETNDSGARIIFVNIEEADAIYTYNQQDSSIYSSAFASYLSWVLAARICGPLTGSEKRTEKIEVRAERELTLAVMKDFGSEQEEPEPESDLIATRTSDVGTIPGTRADDYWPPS